MIDDSLWDLKDPQIEHPGIVLSYDLGSYPVQVALCSKMETAEGADECLFPAPVPPFEAGTQIHFKKTKGFKPDLFSGTNPQARYRGQISAQDLMAIRKEYATLHSVGLLVGRGRL